MVDPVWDMSDVLRVYAQRIRELMEEKIRSGALSNTPCVGVKKFLRAFEGNGWEHCVELAVNRAGDSEAWIGDNYDPWF